MKVRSERWVFTNDRVMQLAPIWNRTVSLVEQILKPSGFGMIRIGLMPISWGKHRGMVWVTVSELRVFVNLIAECDGAELNEAISTLKAEIRDFLGASSVLADDDCWDF